MTEPTKPTHVWQCQSRYTHGSRYQRTWALVPITGETSRSWVAQPYVWKTVKVPKRNYDTDEFAFTEEEKAASDARYADKMWMHKHRHRIADFVSHRGTFTVDTLRQVAALVGYVEPAE